MKTRIVSEDDSWTSLSNSPLTLISTVKYIALLAMVKIVPTHPHLIADYQDEILQSLDDEDVSIRMRALELVSSMVSPRLRSLRAE
jgi:AP-3 complex subunit delta-1